MEYIDVDTTHYFELHMAETATLVRTNSIDFGLLVRLICFPPSTSDAMKDVKS